MTERDLMTEVDENSLEDAWRDMASTVEAYFDNIGDLDDFEEAYCGIFSEWDEDKAIGDYLQDLTDECGDLRDVPDYIMYNIDWEGVGRDARLNGDFYALTVHPGEIAVFRNL